MSSERPPSARRAVSRTVRHRAGLRYIGWRSAFELPRDVLVALWQGSRQRSLDALRFELWSWAATVQALSEREMRAALEHEDPDPDGEEILEDVALGLLVSERLEREPGQTTSAEDLVRELGFEDLLDQPQQDDPPPEH